MKDIEENDKVYLKFSREESSNYITRKAALVKNEDIQSSLLFLRSYTRDSRIYLDLPSMLDTRTRG